MSHIVIIVTKPPPGISESDTVVNVTYHASDDPAIAAIQAAKIDRLTDRIIRIGNGHHDDE